jgi:hypothetical protein
MHFVEIFSSEENIPAKHEEIKCQLDATEVFIADLIACSTSKPASCKPDT